MTTQHRHAAGAPSSQGGRFKSNPRPDGGALTASEPQATAANLALARSAFNADPWSTKLADYADGAVIDELVPDTLTDARSALSRTAHRGGGVPLVRIRYTAVSNPRSGSSRSELDLRPPRDGRPLLVAAESGSPRLTISRGRAVVDLRSSWGNVLDISGDAEVTVIARAGAKCTVSVTGSPTVNVVEEEGSRLRYFDEEKDTPYPPHHPSHGKPDPLRAHFAQLVAEADTTG